MSIANANRRSGTWPRPAVGNAPAVKRFGSLVVGLDVDDRDAGPRVVEQDRLAQLGPADVAGQVGRLDAEVHLAGDARRHLPDMPAGVGQVGGDGLPRAFLLLGVVDADGVAAGVLVAGLPVERHLLR